MERSVRWAARCRQRVWSSFATAARDGVGAYQSRARRSSASSRAVCSRIFATRAPTATVGVGFEGYAIGGLSVGEPIDLMYSVVGGHRATAARATSRAI